MGIDVSENKEVKFNCDHNQGVSTCIRQNPTLKQIEKLNVHSVYSRNLRGQARDDGNPLIYALKGLKAYQISKKEIFKFRHSFQSSLSKIINKLDAIDYVIIIPSSTKIPNYVAKRISVKTGAQLVEGVFVKQTVRNFLAFNFSNAPKRLHRDIKRQLSTWSKIPNEEISLKKVSPKIRKYFPPLVLDSKFNLSLLDGNCILVDDLFASGSTLISARDELQQQSINVSDAVCLLGELKVR